MKKGFLLITLVIISSYPILGQIESDHNYTINIDVESWKSPYCQGEIQPFNFDASLNISEVQTNSNSWSADVNYSFFNVSTLNP